MLRVPFLEKILATPFPGNPHPHPLVSFREKLFSGFFHPPPNEKGNLTVHPHLFLPDFLVIRPFIYLSSAGG